MFKAHKILEAATKWSEDISSSIYGATLTKSLSIVAAGVKLIDVSCIKLETGEFCNITLSNKCLVQTFKRCFTLEIILAKDTSEIYGNFTDFFQYMADVTTDVSEEHNTRQVNKIYSLLYPFTLSSTGDIAGHNKATKRMEDLIIQSFSVFTAIR